jgi:hypothetical protein
MAERLSKSSAERVRNVRRRRRAGLIQLRLEFSKVSLATLARRGYPDMAAFDDPCALAYAIETFFEDQALGDQV